MLVKEEKWGVSFLKGKKKKKKSDFLMGYFWEGALGV